MKISLNWLRDFTEIPASVKPEELSHLFTVHTAEVEGFVDQGGSFDKIVVGQITKIEPHPNADKLRVTKVNVGSHSPEPLQIVCGGTNLSEGQFVAISMVGAKVKWHGEGELITLEPAKIRGVESFGMICAGEEIGVQQQPGGGERPILDLGAYRPTVGQNLAEIFGQSDIIFTVDNKSLTHRPDLWGHYGIAREVAAILKTPFKQQQPQVQFPQAGTSPNIEVKAKKLCSRYVGTIIENVKIGESPEWLKTRLSAIGYRSINNIVDLTNYVMAELGQPLHAFDAEKIATGIIVRTAKKGEKITTLDNVERTLNSDMLVIADHNNPIAIAGVMGGGNSEISDSTTKILIEAATFHPSSVRLTSVKLGLRTEAVQRFEKSLDPHLAHQAMLRICELILQVCPEAKIAGPMTDIKNFKDKTSAVTVDLKKVFSKIGVEIPTEEVLGILTRLEFKPELKGKTKLKVEVPTFRATKDISIEDDLVEEIARMYGYAKIEPTLPNLPIKLPMPNKERRLKHFAREVLSLGMGFNEVYNYSFYSLNDIRKAMLPEEPHIRMQNYLSEDQTHLRISLIPNLLKNVNLNLKHFDQFKIFEIGRTYEDLQEYFPKELKKVGAVIVKGKKNKSEVFYEAKGTLESFLKKFHISLNQVEMRAGESLCPYAHPNKYAAYYLKGSGEELARIFELHPMVLKNFDIENAKVAAVEINFTLLASIETAAVKYKAVPKFPGINFDVSVMIDRTMPIGKLQNTIAHCDKTLIQEVKLFDLYEGDKIPTDKKSLAFSVHMQSDERTLTDAEMKQTHQKITEELTKLGGEIR